MGRGEGKWGGGLGAEVAAMGGGRTGRADRQMESGMSENKMKIKSRRKTRDV